MAFLTDTFAAQGSFGEKIASLWAQVSEARAKRAVFRQTFSELSSLSSRELADLGIARSMIRRIAYQAAYDS
ncbi:DUF1127 domain-containing protein [Planktotalea sp.]|uniref:DUF1127 domain-containing protein n=1 Tax=Planktotalea sp. TaxID=2029877 RepID=UPI003D6AC407